MSSVTDHSLRGYAGNYCGVAGLTPSQVTIQAASYISTTINKLEAVDVNTSGVLGVKLTASSDSVEPVDAEPELQFFGESVCLRPLDWHCQELQKSDCEGSSGRWSVPI
jgi:hypothetical protein